MKQFFFIFFALISILAIAQGDSSHQLSVKSSTWIPDYIYVPALAGFLGQLLSLWEAIKQDPSRQPDFKSFIYWIPYLIAPILGGVAGYYSFGGNNINSFTPALGIQVGLSSPLLLKGLITAVAPKTTPPPGS